MRIITPTKILSRSLSMCFALFLGTQCSHHAETPKNEETPLQHYSRESLLPQEFSADAFPRINTFYKQSDTKKIKTRVEYDFNSDGRTDFIEYFDPTGTFVTRQMADLNGDGIFDVIYILAPPQKNSAKQEVVEQQFLTQMSGSVGVWKHYQNGQLVRREVDRKGTGQPDLWEYYHQNRLVRVERDDDGDGQPDSRPHFRKKE